MSIPRDWERDPNGSFLKYDKDPIGRRTPNGQVWGHSLSDFFLIKRIPGLCYATIWSTSMIQWVNDNLTPSQKDHLAADDHHFPRVLQPWPLLCVPNDKGELETLCLADEGCGHGHDPRSMLHRVRDVDDTLEAGSMKRSLTPEQNILAARMNLKQTLTKDMSPEMMKVDPRFHIPDQTVPSNERLPPKLEEFIPKEYLPDVLLVHDPHGVAVGVKRYPSDGHVQFDAGVPIRYKRALPEPMTDGHAGNVAHLYLSPSNLCGRGNHSFVYHAPLVLPAPLTARTPSRQVTVLAKISFPEREHRGLLSQEGVVYNTFPQWMMEDYCGYNIVYEIIVSVLGYHRRSSTPTPESRACMCHSSKILWFLRSGRDSESFEPHSTARRLWFAYQDIYSTCRQQVRFSRWPPDISLGGCSA